MKKLALSSIVVTLAAVLAFADAPKVKEQVLKAGKYQAKVSALVCEGCPGFVDQTMNSRKSIAFAKTDPQTSLVTFAVKQGAQENVAELQKALKGAADQMGMGADYQLKDIKKIN